MSCKLLKLFIVLILIHLGLPMGAMAERESGHESKNDALVWVARSNGEQQCFKETAIPLEQGSKPLLDAKIKIYDSKKSPDGERHAQVCGGSRGFLNCYLVSKKQLSQALELGYIEFH